jgi:hypothetical protein
VFDEFELERPCAAVPAQLLGLRAVGANVNDAEQWEVKTYTAADLLEVLASAAQRCSPNG